MSICLTMIVKNESEVIERCIDSVREHIAHWVIVDTGSTDGTQELVRRLLADIDGELYEREWVSFGHNRTESIELARGKADHLLLFDADMTLELLRPDALANLTADAYNLRYSGNIFAWSQTLMVSGKLPWRYVGVTHEYITSDAPHVIENLHDVLVHHHADGGSRADKFERDLSLLSGEHERDPSDPRTVFYLAQTHRDLGHAKEAVHFYRLRAAMGGWSEELYYSLYEAGKLLAAQGEWPQAMQLLIEAWQHRPPRLEAAYELASGLRVKGNYVAAHRFSTLAEDGPIPVPDDVLFLSPWVYRYGLLFEFSITCYWVGELEKSIAACDQLLEIDELPDAYREQTARNRAIAQEALAGR